MNLLQILKCRTKKTFYLIIGKKRTAIASFPRSGNTWVRYVIEEATGLKSGSIYNDRIMPRTGEGIVIKTHKLDSFCYTDAIHVIRNPFDAIESYFYWKTDFTEDNKLNWAEHVYQAVNYWKSHTEHWMHSKCKKYVVRYEDLLINPRTYFNDLLSWLGYDPDPEILSTVIKASNISAMRKLNPKIGEKFFRQGLIGQGMEKYSKKQKKFIINNLRKYLDYYNYFDFIRIF